MNVTRMAARTFGALLLILASPGDFNERDWARSRQILIEDANAAAAYLLVELDPAVYAGAQEDLDDLRIVDDRGAQIPSKLILESDERKEELRRAETLDSVISENGRTLLTLDLGAAPPRHNRVTLETSDRNFSRRVTIETSADNRTFAVARTDGYIFDFSRDETAQFLAIDYPASTRRYLRLAIWNEGQKPLTITDASVYFLLDREARLAEWPAKLTDSGRDQKKRESLLRLDLGSPKLPHSRLELATSARNFHRHVEIEGSRDGEYWSSIGDGEIFSVALDDFRREQLQIDYPESRFRFLRLRIFDYDDAPIAIGSARIYGRPRRLLFHREPGRSYRLLYGNATAAAPRYDLERLAPYLDPAQFKTVGLSAERTMEPEAPPKAVPWYERQPLWLWATMGIAGIVLGVLIYRLARLTSG